MSIKFKKTRGFTLIEIAIVLIVLTILLGYTVAMVPVQQELKQYRKADKEMDKILDALYAYAQVNGRLPCADDMASADGVADPETATTSCTVWYGYIPSKTLGLEGNLNAQFSILDPWGQPYRYQVTQANGGGFVNDIQAIGIPSFAPDLEVCTIHPAVGAEEPSCGSAAKTVAKGIPAVVLSLGKDIGRNPSGIQKENLDNGDDSNSNGSFEDYVFVKSTRSNASGDEFDDVVKWIVPNVLYSKMIDAGKLP